MAPYCRRICHDPLHCSDTSSLVYDAEKQHLIPAWTVFFAFGASLHNKRLVFACREGTPVSRQLLFAIRDSHWGLQHQHKCGEFLHKQFNINNATSDAISVDKFSPTWALIEAVSVDTTGWALTKGNWLGCWRKDMMGCGSLSVGVTKSISSIAHYSLV